MTRTGDWLMIWAFLFLTVLGAAPFAQADLKVYATVDRNEMSQGDTFTYTISVSSENSVNVQEPRLPDLSGFDLINSWSGSESRSTFANGTFEVQQTRNFNYMLSPTKTGQVTLGGAQVVVDGRAYTTKPINVTVHEGSAPSVPPQAQQDGSNGNDPFTEMEDMFNQLLQRRMNPGFRSQPVNPKEAFFIQVEVDKTKVYAGEQVTASWYLYTRGQIRDIDTLKYPSLNGFWKEEIELATRLNFSQEVLNGLVYKKALLASFALFPIKAGKATVDPYKAKCTVVTGSPFGFGRPYQFTKASRPVEIEVMPVPVEGRPEDYTGAVGRFEVSAMLDQKSVKVNQPVTLKLRFSGRGNAKLVDLPSLNLPPSLELYDSKNESKFFKNGTSYKEFELLLIPREAGEVVLPETSVSLFDPETGKYYSQTIPEQKIEVLPGEGPQAIPSTRLSEAEKEKAAEPQLPGPVLTYEQAASVSLTHRTVVWGAVYSLVLFLLGWRSVVELGWGRRKKDLNKILQRRLKSVHSHLDRGEWRQVGVEMTNLVYFTLGELSGQGGANMEIEKMLLKAPPSVRREISEPLTRLMSQYEALTFAPEAVVGNLKDKKPLRKLVADMEKLLFKAVRLGTRSTRAEEENSDEASTSPQPT